MSFLEHNTGSDVLNPQRIHVEEVNTMENANAVLDHLENPSTTLSERIATEHEGRPMRHMPNEEFNIKYLQVVHPEPKGASVEELLSDAIRLSEEHNPDAGARAREALAAFNVLKVEHRRRFIRFWTGWLVFLLLVGGVLFGLWKILPEYMITGRYTVVAECKVPFGDSELTGKRTYSYAYKSLFGYHLVDESTRLERTTLDINGNKLTILGQNGEKWWRQNISLGEKGIAILKHADTYWFVSDKNTALVPYSGFCN